MTKEINKHQNIINTKSQLTGAYKKKINDYYRVALTYTSNKLEGNSLFESETEAVINHNLIVSGKPLNDSYEASGHALAYDYMISLAKRKTIRERDILHLHKLFYRQINFRKAGNRLNYHPDFLIEKIDGKIEIHEVKGGQFMQNLDTMRKHDRAKMWCKQRGMNFIVISKD